MDGAGNFSWREGHWGQLYIGEDIRARQLIMNRFSLFERKEVMDILGKGPE